jgi:enoyl-CoA hydratase/carnithine racemase
LEKRLSGTLATGAEILSETANHVAFITLNRPEALNALSYEMITELRKVLQACAKDDGVRAIVLQGAGDKAFCAGGDIRALYQSFKDSGKLHHDFFVAEYSLDYRLHTYPKPYVALIDGITMGGGMGLAQGSTLRVVGERTRIAMPEVGIGLFPDVGASYFLSRLPGSLGPYLALTGVRFAGRTPYTRGWRMSFCRRRGSTPSPRILRRFLGPTTTYWMCGRWFTRAPPKGCRRPP